MLLDNLRHTNFPSKYIFAGNSLGYCLITREIILNARVTERSPWLILPTTDRVREISPPNERRVSLGIFGSIQSGEIYALPEIIAGIGQLCRSRKRPDSFKWLVLRKKTFRRATRFKSC